MKKLLNSTMATLLFTLLAVTSLHAAGRDWLDGKVIESGYTRDMNGHRVPTVTVVLLDPGNSNPDIRRQTLIVTAASAVDSRKSEVDLSVGMEFQAYRVGTGYGGLMMRYQDKKGNTKSELHMVAGEL